MCGNVDEHIGRRLLCRRRALGLTQDQLGAAIGVRLQQIQRYECAANKVSASRLWQLAEALDVPITYFFEGLRDTQAVQDDGRPRRAA